PATDREENPAASCAGILPRGYGADQANRRLGYFFFFATGAGGGSTGAAPALSAGLIESSASREARSLVSASGSRAVLFFLKPSDRSRQLDSRSAKYFSAPSMSGRCARGTPSIFLMRAWAARISGMTSRSIICARPPIVRLPLWN